MVSITFDCLIVTKKPGGTLVHGWAYTLHILQLLARGDICLILMATLLNVRILLQQLHSQKTWVLAFNSQSHRFKTWDNRTFRLDWSNCFI
jgi:hypothetical protein